MQPIDISKDFIRYWVYPVLRPRRFHAFGVGMPKSGTHSIEAIFTGYRTWHEPRIERFMEIIRKREEGEMSDARARDLIRGLDRRMSLELNSSWLNYFLLDLYVEEFPEAKFVLTIRDCYSWLDSVINHLLGREHGDYQIQFQRWLGDSLTHSEHQEEDKVLAEHGLYPLDSWLRYWSEHNSNVLKKVPAERLLVIRTFEIKKDIPKLADFLDVPAHTLDDSSSHQYKAAKKFGLLSKIDGDYLEQRVEKYCKELMQQFFPEIRRLSDIRGYRPEDKQGIES